MTGSEQSGMANAKSDLFENAACIITPTAKAPKGTIQTLETFWKSIGMTVSTFSPEAHDQIVAHISHLPHIIASTLCNYLSKKDPEWHKLSGGGLRDTTRIASGDAEIWKQILEQNRDEILSAINGFEQQIQILKKALDNNDPARVRAELSKGKQYRDQF